MRKWIAVLGVLLCVDLAHAEVQIETILDGLDNPCGVAVQPSTGHVFLSESGAGRVIRVVEGEAVDVIVGYPVGAFGDGPTYAIGPLGLAFLNKDTLVVGGSGPTDGKDLLRVYDVSGANDAAIQADDTVDRMGPLKAAGEIPGAGNFFAVAATDAAVYATCISAETKGCVAKAERNEKLSELTRFLVTTDEAEVDNPVGATISPGGHLVLGQIGEVSSPNDSMLSFFAADSGKLLLHLETGLYDIVSLVYGQKSGRLYALDFAWMDATQGGLYRLDANRTGKVQSVETVKMTPLDKPTAMAFGQKGGLYVTVFGTAEEGSDAKPGKLLKIEPGL